MAHQSRVAQSALRAKWALKGLMMPARNLAHLPNVITSLRLSGMGDRDRAYARAAATLARLRLLRVVWVLRQAVGLPS